MDKRPYYRGTKPNNICFTARDTNIPLSALAYLAVTQENEELIISPPSVCHERSTTMRTAHCSIVQMLLEKKADLTVDFPSCTTQMRRADIIRQLLTAVLIKIKECRWRERTIV